MVLSHFGDLVQVVCFWFRWVSFLFQWLRPRSSPSDILINKLIAKLKCESLVTPRPFDPVGLSVCPDGTIAVVSGPHHAVKLYYADGQHLKTYDDLWYPRSVAFGPDSLLVVSDTGNHRIQYYQKGEEVRTLNLSVEFPIGTCLTSDSRLIIIDWKGAKMLRNGKISAPVKGSRIAKIYKVNWNSGEATRKGKILRGIQMPWNLAYSKITDKIYVIDDGDRSIKIFDPETGRMITQIGPRVGFGRKLGYMYGICVDEDGDILVSEAEHGQILIFKADGNAFSGPYVVADEGLSRPMGVGITPEGYLAVADRYNHCIRLYKYKRDATDCLDCLEMGGVCPKCRDHQYMNKGWKGRRQATTRLNIREERARLIRKREADRKKTVKTGGAELTVKAFE